MNKFSCVVCGMEINEKNYDFNKEAFIQANHIEKIKFCPFCGAPIKFLEVDGQMLQYNSDSLNENSLKIIDHAFKLEIFNGDFYKKASFLAKDGKIKKMFQALSRIEYTHAKIHKRIGGFKEDPVLRDMNYSKYDSDEILLEMACKREKHAVEYYNKYLDEIQEKNIRTVFKVLSAVEEGHIELTTITPLHTSFTK